MESTRSMLKWPLIIAAFLVLVRIPLELAGAPDALTNILGVAWLHLLVPFFFASMIAKSGVANPYKSLFSSLLVFSVLTRLMVMPTYWAAYALNWTAPRCAIQNGGVVGEGVTPFAGLLLVPVRNVILWTVFAVVVGMILGSVVIAVRRRSAASAA